MPFTVSHAVLAPIFNRLSGRTLPLAALAIGCMAPDLYRIFTSTQYHQLHRWDSIFSHTLWIGMGFCLLWYGLYRPVLYRIFALQDPLNLDNFKRIFIFLCQCVIAILLGISSHLIWDGLTHVDFRTFAFHDFLAQPLTLFGHSYPLHSLLQIGSSVVFLPIVLWMIWHYARSYHQHFATTKAVKYLGAMILGLSLLLGLFSMLDYLRHIPTQYLLPGLYHFTSRSLNEFAQGFIVSLTLGCLLFLFLDRERRLG